MQPPDRELEPPPTQDRRLLATKDGEIARHVARIAEEFRMGFQVVAEIDRPAATVFGSARLGEGSPEYAVARATGAAFARQGFAVITGGGPGLMEAVNRGAREAGGLSVGFNIELPHEQDANAYLDVCVTFNHFYARKTMFVKAAEGFVVLAGGFGTMDEMFEALTLIQTEKVVHFPVVLVGRAYWQPLLDWIQGRVLGEGAVSEEDLQLLSVTDDPDEAARTVVECYRVGCAKVLPAHPRKADAQ